MATIFARENKDGSKTFRMMIRRKGIPPVIMSFSSYEEAADWVSQNERKYIENPEPYLKWIEKVRLHLKRQREFDR